MLKMHKCSTARLHNRTNAQMHKCTNADLNARMHKCEVLKCTTAAQMHKCATTQMLKRQFKCTCVRWIHSSVRPFHPLSNRTSPSLRCNSTNAQTPIQMHTHAHTCTTGSIHPSFHPFLSFTPIHPYPYPHPHPNPNTESGGF